MGTHTEGAWRSQIMQSGDYEILAGEGRGCTFIGRVSDDNAKGKANAALIAAAPDMHDMLYALTVLGWTVEKVSCYDEEGVEGWRWQDRNGQDIATEVGGWDELPEWGDKCREAFSRASGGADRGADPREPHDWQSPGGSVIPPGIRHSGGY